MAVRELTRAEKLVAELAEVERKERQFESWRWKSSTWLVKSLMRTTRVTETRVLGFSRTSRENSWDEIPYEVAREFHSFLAMKRGEAHIRRCEIEKELEEMS